MHYYKKNIGDYHKKAGRLSMLEHGAYTLLLDACYDREDFPSMDEAIDWAWARTDLEVAAVQFVLAKFFTLVDGKYVQQRVMDELHEYKQKAETNSRIAKEREAKRKSTTRTVHDSSPESHEPPPNHKPITINQEPINTSSLRSDGPCDAGLASKAMRSVGMQTANPSDPRLMKLLDEGVTIDELTDAAAEAVTLGKPFAYALGIAAGRRGDAKRMQVGKPQGPKTPAPENFESKNYGTGVTLV